MKTRSVIEVFEDHFRGISSPRAAEMLGWHVNYFLSFISPASPGYHRRWRVGPAKLRRLAMELGFTPAEVAADYVMRGGDLCSEYRWASTAKNRGKR